MSIDFLVDLVRIYAATRIFRKLQDSPPNLGGGRVKRNKICTEDSQIFGASLINLFVQAFVSSWIIVTLVWRLILCVL